MRVSSLDGAQVLVIDDDETIRAALRRIVEMAGAIVTHAGTGEEGLRRLYSGRPDVVVLDITSPASTAGRCSSALRQLTDLPVMMLSSHADELEKVRALHAGADDYVTYRDAALAVDFIHAEATAHDQPIPLTPREFRLLAAFVGHPGRTLSPEQLLDLARDDPAGDPRRVKVYVGYLRAKLAAAGLDPPPIDTVRGFGYRYGPPAGRR
jgi:DNA-binding response OmpR family regulator